uniref:Uncharacterized protein n=1 Tax=Rhizophora mucronata TaxID=61149 RepID=A0A2P2PX57_RHIMU
MSAQIDQMTYFPSIPPLFLYSRLSIHCPPLPNVV